MIRLVLADMDGTLVPVGAEDSGVSERTIRAVAAMREAGVVFGPSTGRISGDVVRFFRNDPSVLHDGILASGRIVYAGGRMVRHQSIDRGVLRRVTAAAAKASAVVSWCVDPYLEGRTDEVSWRVVVPPALEGMSEAFSRALGGAKVVSEVPEGDEFFVAGLAFDEGEVDPELVRRTVEDACPDVSVMHTIPGWFDVNERGWSKHRGLAPILEALGITRDEVAFIGDSENDVPLMAEVGHPLCVADGQQVAKDAAEMVIGASVEDGPAELMEHLARTGGVL